MRPLYIPSTSTSIEVVLPRSRRAQDAVLRGGVSPRGPGIAPGRSASGGTGGLSPPHLGIAPVVPYHDRCARDQTEIRRRVRTPSEQTLAVDLGYVVSRHNPAENTDEELVVIHGLTTAIETELWPEDPLLPLDAMVAQHRAVPARIRRVAFRAWAPDGALVGS